MTATNTASAKVIQRRRDETRDAERYRWLNEPGRRWTFWLGRTYENSITTWPVFDNQSMDDAIDSAMEREAMRKAAAVQV